MTASLDAGVYTYSTLEMPHYGLSVPVVSPKDDASVQYVALRAVCLVLGIDSRSQLEVINADPTLAEGLQDIPVKTGAGWRVVAGLRRQEFGLWLAGINTSRIKAEIRDQFAAFRQDVMLAIDRLLWGPAPAVSADRRDAVTVSIRVEIHMACQDCGAPHLVIHENGVNTIIREHR